MGGRRRGKEARGEGRDGEFSCKWIKRSTKQNPSSREMLAQIKGYINYHTCIHLYIYISIHRYSSIFFRPTSSTRLPYLARPVRR